MEDLIGTGCWAISLAMTGAMGIEHVYVKRTGKSPQVVDLIIWAMILIGPSYWIVS